MTLIQFTNLSFTYPGAAAPLFDHLSVNLDDHWKLGLIGRNGRGKTTFLNLLRGQLDAHGTLQAPQRFTYFPADLDTTGQTVLQVMTTGAAPDWRAAVELDRIGLPADIVTRSFASLSGGEQTKVLLARGFVDETAFPLIDEPTNHLDIAGRQAVGRYLRRKHGFICVSHDEHFLDQFVDHVLVLNRHSVDLVAGNVTTWRRDKQRRDQAAQAQNERLHDDIQRLRKRTAVQRQWAQKREGQSTDAASRRAAKKLMRRAKVFEERTTAKVTARQGLLQDVETATDLTTSLQHGQGEQLWLSLRDFAVCRAGQALFDPIDLDFHQGDQLAILGANGSGKSSLIGDLLHRDPLDHVGYCLNQLPADIGYLSQAFAPQIRHLMAQNWGDDATRTRVWNIMHQLGVARERLRAPATDWSMGEAKKAALAITLSQPHALLVWDEPTNYLDLPAREQLGQLLRATQPTLITIDHDLHFLETTCPTRLQLRPRS